MSNIRGGDIQLLTLGGRVLHPAENGEFEIALGGNSLSRHRSGDGYSWKNRETKPGFIKGPVIGDDNNNILTYLQGLADAGDDVAAVIKMPDGTTYSGKMCPMGDISQKADGTIDVDLEGDKLEPQ